VTAAQPSATAPVEFIVTQEYLRFAEFCDACREARYIGLCYGVPGVGKTVSARQYAHWDELESILGPPPHRFGTVPRPDSGPWRTVFYTPGVVNTPRTVERELDGLRGTVMGLATRVAYLGDPQAVARQPRPAPELVIVDEADRLKPASLEQVRDFLRSPPRRPGAHRHAWITETAGAIRAAVLAHWLRASLQAVERTGTASRD